MHFFFSIVIERVQQLLKLNKSLVGSGCDNLAHGLRGSSRGSRRSRRSRNRCHQSLKFHQTAVLLLQLNAVVSPGVDVMHRFVVQIRHLRKLLFTMGQQPLAGPEFVLNVGRLGFGRARHHKNESKRGAIDSDMNFRVHRISVTITSDSGVFCIKMDCQNILL